MILDSYFVVRFCGSWTFKEPSVVISWGSWFVSFCFIVESWKSRILILCFVMVSWVCCILTMIFREILHILNHETLFCCRILWILDDDFRLRHMSAPGCGPRATTARMVWSYEWFEKHCIEVSQVSKTRARSPAAVGPDCELIVVVL